MIFILWVIVAVFAVLAAALAAALVRAHTARVRENAESKTQCARLEALAASKDERVRILEGELDALRSEKNELLADKIEATNRLSALNQKLAMQQERMQEHAAEEEKMRQRLSADFENLSNRIFEASREKLAQSNLRQVGMILDPLKENLNDFRARVEKLSKEAVENRSLMEGQIKGLADMSMRLGKNAESLAAALKGNNKIAGNWGESVLERILESAGFKEGVNYRSQASFPDADGRQNRLVPDFVIDLPHSRSLIIDSKLSLSDYVDYCTALEADNAPSMRASLEKFKKSVRAHLKSLAGKYNNIPEINSGFKMMFMPIEPAYALAVQSDSKLLEDAFNANVLIVSPSTVMSVLKFAQIAVRNDALDANMRKLSVTGKLLSERLTRFTERFKALGVRIGQLGKEYEDTSKTLYTGRESVMITVDKFNEQSLKAIASTEGEDE